MMGALRYKNIFTKIITPIICLIFVCGIAMSFLAGQLASGIKYEDVMSAAGSLLLQIDENISNLLNQLGAMMNVSDSSQYFRNLLSEPKLGQLKQFEARMDLHRYLYNFYSIFEEYGLSMTLIGRNGITYTTYEETLLADVDALLAEPWVDHFKNARGTFVATLDHAGISTNTQGKRVILFAKPLIHEYTAIQCATMLVELDPAYLVNLYAGSYGEGDKLFITDGEGRVISSSDAQAIQTTLEGFDAIPVSIDRSWDASKARHTFPFNGTRYFALRIPSALPGGYLVKYIDSGLVQTQAWALRATILALNFACCCVVAVAAWLLLRRVVRPIKALSVRMENTKYGLPASVNAARASGDEIDGLSRTFENLLRAMDEYTDKMIVESEARREAEFRTLQSQINPHFLYNTLSSIRVMTEQGYPREKISEAIVLFIRMLRGTITNRYAFIPLSDEIENLSTYILLQNIRQEGHIAWNVFCPDQELLASYLPKLLLQPIVENAVFHAGHTLDKPLQITLYVSRLDTTLRLEITDNGQGIAPEKLAEIIEFSEPAKADTRFSGIGLANIQHRIHLLYGTDYGMQISSEPGVGTSVRITLPFAKSPGERT